MHARTARYRNSACRSGLLSNGRADELERRRGIEPAVVERTAGDRAREFCTRLQQRPHVVERGESAGRDHRNADRLGERDRGVEIEPLRRPSRAISV